MLLPNSPLGVKLSAMNENEIIKIIDRHLDLGYNKIMGQPELEMVDPNQDANDELKTWFPIKSRVTDSDIGELETQIGHKLPIDYKVFLKHKHFYKLHISECAFQRHEINSWKTIFVENVFNGPDPEYLIEKGYLPFADHLNFGGVFCFDTNQNTGDNNYPIVLWDSEEYEDVRYEDRDFYGFLVKLDNEVGY
jgi:SMI1-KNR4 cell-wall